MPGLALCGDSRYPPLQPSRSETYEVYNVHSRDLTRETRKRSRFAPLAKVNLLQNFSRFSVKNLQSYFLFFINQHEYRIKIVI